jgi:hypothetical protein
MTMGSSAVHVSTGPDVAKIIGNAQMAITMMYQRAYGST